MKTIDFPTKIGPILISWFLEHRRQLPWRPKDLQSMRDPYMVWISETMLQQTRVEAVIAHFLGWMRELPTVEHLAHAEEATVLRLWQGLGYYSRARNLRKGAQYILEHFHGEIPENPVLLQKIPGIGEYTAGAVASLAFHSRSPILDGNLVRLFSRWNLWKHLPTESKSWKEKYWSLSRSFAESEHPHLINEALMEFGAKICVPKSPSCSICPIQNFCPAYAKGIQETLPPKKPKQEEVEILGTIYRIGDSEHILATKSRSGFLKNQWRLPFTDSHLTPSTLLSPLKVGMTKSAGKIRHSITHHRFCLDVQDIRLSPPRLPLKGEWQWFTRKDFRKAVANSLSVKALEK